MWNKDDYDAYLQMYQELSDLMRHNEAPNSLQKSLISNFDSFFWEYYRNGNCNVYGGLESDYWGSVVSVANHLRCWSDDDLEDYFPDSALIKQATEIFDEDTCQQLIEDFSALEIMLSLNTGAFGSGPLLITSEQHDAILKAVSPAIDTRDPYYGIMARIVDWCLANPFLVNNDGEKVEGRTAEHYHQLMMSAR